MTRVYGLKRGVTMLSRSPGGGWHWSFRDDNPKPFGSIGAAREFALANGYGFEVVIVEI